MMHTCSLAMLLLVLASSFLAQPNLISVIEARRLTTSSNGGDVFKLDLIHRDSPRSPYYNPSMTLKERRKKFPLGYISRGHNIRLSSTSYNYNTSDVALYDLIGKQNLGEYLIKISIGTPKVDFFAEIDTGSNLIWVQCLPCEHCISNISAPFDPTKSSTFEAIQCNTPACNKPLFLNTSCASDNTTESSSSCHYQAFYGSGSSSGILATDTISLSSSNHATSLSLPSSVFGCGMDQTILHYDGILGLGLGPSSWISQLGPSINHKFSYCLTSLTSGVTSKLAFGANVTGPGLVTTPFMIGTDDTNYHLTLNGIGIGEKEIPMPSPSGLDILIDSGTTYTTLPPSVYDGVKTALGNAIGPSSQELDGVLCVDPSEHFNMPDVVFRFKGADVVLKKANVFYELEGLLCLAMAAVDETYIFGNIAQINFHVGYDVKLQQVSFAPTNCTNFK